jgi:oligopeptide/dipeptide ABC transporter ATP-binding protein
MIAIALACKPALLIADEPTTALDVTVQAQILDLLRELQRESGLTLLLITHDLGVVAEIAHHVYVMYAGRMVEHAPAEAILRKPLHPYTAALLACTPRLTAERGSFAFIPGQVPEPTHRPSGCAFHPRCELTVARAKAAPERSIRVLEPEHTHESTAVVLEHCVRDIPGKPSGVPTLNQVRPGRFVACWESECSSAVRDIDSFHGHCAATENG